MIMKIDKQNRYCAFNEETHTYWDTRNPNKTYTSVTTLIHSYTEVFDESFWSRFKALEKLITADKFKTTEVRKILIQTKKWNDKYCSQLGVDLDELERIAEEIREGYKKTNKEACDYGTAHHLEQELKFYKSDKHSLGLFDSRFANCKQEFECKKNYYELDLDYAIYPEYLVYWESKDESLRVSGQMDLLIKEGNDIYIMDYKTNSKGIEEKSYFDPRNKKYKMMQYPLNNLMDCNLIHYQLQLSTYAWMLQKINPEFKIKSLTLKHQNRDGIKTDYEVEYVPKEVERMLKDYKKKLYIDSERNKRNASY